VAGYSRIYLAHHFLIDVFVGAIIGILFGSLSVIWVNRNWDNIVRFFAKKLYSGSDEHMPNFPSLQ
jgi:undecaprenyl-diphosphatase